MVDIWEAGLGRNRANYSPLTPLSFLARAARVYPAKTAIVHGRLRYSYREFDARCRQLASALIDAGVARGDTVAILANNTPAMLEAHFGVPMMGGVLNALNFRLDAATIAFCLEHGGAKVLIADCEYVDTVRTALAQMENPPFLVEIEDTEANYGSSGATRLGPIDYEGFIAAGNVAYRAEEPQDEWQALALGYTSGTTGNPKGVVYHHRGAYLNALGNVITMKLDASSVFLWTLPMFHCNGWCFTWAMVAACGTHICLRKVDPAIIYPMIPEHGVTHLCGAPVVLNLLANAPDQMKVRLDRVVEVGTGGAAPPSPIIEAMNRNGFNVTHLYGLTETYGPATVCAWQESWDGLDIQSRARHMAKQGVPHIMQEELMVADPETMVPVPADGATIGEVMIRGNTVMKGYLRNPKATEEAFRSGWYHSGDLGVWHPDGYVEVKDRAKDIIISGGENISSLEVEEVLYRHPKVLEAAVVARPDEKWGETPCAFITLRDGTSDTAPEEIMSWCREHLARFKVPRTIVFCALPKTSTGKIQKFVLREQAKALER
jgi:fatty-acyl-CoA synthase